VAGCRDETRPGPRRRWPPASIRYGPGARRLPGEEDSGKLATGTALPGVVTGPGVDEGGRSSTMRTRSERGALEKTRAHPRETEREITAQHLSDQASQVGVAQNGPVNKTDRGLVPAFPLPGGRVGPGGGKYRERWSRVRIPRRLPETPRWPTEDDESPGPRRIRVEARNARENCARMSHLPHHYRDRHQEPGLHSPFVSGRLLGCLR